MLLKSLELLALNMVGFYQILEENLGTLGLLLGYKLYMDKAPLYMDISYTWGDPQQDKAPS